MPAPRLPSLLALALVLAAAPAAAQVGSPPAAPAEELTLAEALARLDADSPTLQQATARADGARSMAQQAAAALLPSIAATGSYTRNSAEAKMSIDALFDGIEAGVNALSPVPITLDRSEVPADLIIQPLEQWSGAISARMALFAGHAYADLAAALAGGRAAEATVDGVRAQLRASLAQAAWLGAAAESFVEATERAEANAQEHAASAQRGVSAGLFPQLYALQAQAELAARQADGVRARAAVERSRLALGALLGRDGAVRVTVPLDAIDVSQAPATSGSHREELEDAIPRRPELRATAEQLQLARAQRTSAWLRHAPTLGASFSAMASDVAFPTGDTTAWRFSLDLQWVLFDGGFRYGKLAEARAATRGAAAAVHEQQIAIGRELREAGLELAVAEEALRLARVRRDTAQAASASAERAFQAGTLSSMDAVDAAERSYLADVGEIDARARLAVARIGLRRAQGLPVDGSVTP
jgi:outer membrane protein TolC